MKPLIHAKISMKRHGGHFDDYLPVHNFIDQTKVAMPDIRHRAILHSSFGCYMAEQVFGVYIVNSDGKEVSVRDLYVAALRDVLVEGDISRRDIIMENFEIVKSTILKKHYKMFDDNFDNNCLSKLIKDCYK